VARDDPFRRYLEAGALLGEITRARAEEFVRDLTNGEGRASDRAQHWVDELVTRSVQAGEQLIELIRSEVETSLEVLGFSSLDDMAHQVADVLSGRGRDTGRTPTGSEPRTADDPAPAKQGTAKEAPATQTPAKKSAAKQTPAKKSTAKKSTAKQTTAKKTTAKKSTAKKSTAKEAPAKKSATARPRQTESGS
jgi:Histone H1-like nucleoprotein HC2